MNCLFCKIIRGDIPSTKVFENEHFFVFLDINPVNHGHTLIVPKAHHETLFDMPANLAGEMMQMAQSIGRAVTKATSAGGVNIMMNNLRPAGQLVDHAHLHVIPRHADDGLKHWTHKIVTPEELAQTGEKIVALL